MMELNTNKILTKKSKVKMKNQKNKDCIDENNI
jgi:hypothetical protein